MATALAAYGDLAARGNDLVARVRGQQATPDLKAQASTTVSHAKATATTAKKATASTASTASSATKSAAKKTTSTAKKNAAKTKTSAKSTATSAKKTATAAQKAVEDTAAKTGNTGNTADTPANTHGQDRQLSRPQLLGANNGVTAPQSPALRGCRAPTPDTLGSC